MYRIVVDLLQPHVLLSVWVGLAVVQLWRKGTEHRRRLVWLIIPLLALLAITTPAASYLALGTLEWSYPPLEQRPEGVHAIVVLAGDIRPPVGARKKAELGVDTLYRCLTAAEVYSQGPACPVLVSGGAVDSNSETAPAAEWMREFLVKLGVRDKDVLVERRSQSTWENAVESSELLQKHGLKTIVLVTDAAHMQRASACFRKQGLEVVPCGCRYRALLFAPSLEVFLPDPGAARGMREAWHEWVGIGWYWLAGKI